MPVASAQGFRRILPSSPGASSVRVVCLPPEAATRCRTLQAVAALFLGAAIVNGPPFRLLNMLLPWHDLTSPAQKPRASHRIPAKYTAHCCGSCCSSQTSCSCTETAEHTAFSCCFLRCFLNFCLSIIKPSCWSSMSSSERSASPVFCCWFSRCSCCVSSGCPGSCMHVISSGIALLFVLLSQSSLNSRNCCS